MGKASRRKASRVDGDRAPNASARPSGAQRAATSVAPAASVFSGRALWVTIALAVATVVIYAPVRHYPFVNTDDPVYVTANPNVLLGLTWDNVGWAFTEAKVPYWHPLTFLSHMLDVQVFGANAGGHHITNVLLHIASSVMLFGLFLQMTGSLGRSAVVAALFGLHPLRVESVAWVAERKDALSTFFWIATTWAYVRHVRRPQPKRYAAVIVLFALGLMAKPMMVTLPFALLLLDYWPLDRIELGAASTRRHGVSIRALLKEKIPLFGLAVFASLITFGAQQQVGAVESLEAVPLTLRVANAVHSYVAYIGDLIWPVPLAALYPYPKTFSTATLLLGLLALVVVTVLVVAARRRYPYLVVGWLWYVGTLLPVIGLIQVGPQARADRFTYVPDIGLLLMIVWGVGDLLRRWPHRRVVLIPLAAGAVAACVVAAMRQVSYWRSSTALWEHTLAVTRDNGVAHYNYGVELEAAKRHDDAIRHLREAVRLEPDFATAHNRLALALNRRGDFAGATAQLAEVVRLMPASAAAHSNLGASLAKEGKNAEAIAALSQAVLLNPQDATSRGRLEFLRRGGTVKPTAP